jgi:hypothetical protein
MAHMGSAANCDFFLLRKHLEDADRNAISKMSLKKLLYSFGSDTPVAGSCEQYNEFLGSKIGGEFDYMYDYQVFITSIPLSWLVNILRRVTQLATLFFFKHNVSIKEIVCLKFCKTHILHCALRFKKPFRIQGLLILEA